MTAAKAKASAKAPPPASQAVLPQAGGAWADLPAPEAGRLGREERVLVAMDVLARFSSRQRKFILGSHYLEGPNPYDGPLEARAVDSREIARMTVGPCTVCAKGALFLASIDRFDDCQLRMGLLERISTKQECEPSARVREDLGIFQADAIERCYEGWGLLADYRFVFGWHNRRACLKAICRNIIRNDGIFIPEQDLPAQPGGKAAS